MAARGGCLVASWMLSWDGRDHQALGTAATTGRTTAHNGQ
jgi:hypothetical protein